MPKKYRKFDFAFKENVVKLSYEKKCLQDFADELKIYASTICRWRREYNRFGSGSFPGPGYPRVHPDQKRLFELERESRKSDLRLEILKIATPYLFQGKPIIYEFIKNHEDKYSIHQMCKILGICKRTYFKWKKNGIPKKHREVAELKEEIASIFLSSKKCYGRDKITKELNSRGFKIGPRQVSNYMFALGLRSKAKRKFKTTTDSKHSYNTAPNILNQEFITDAPSKVWVSDITYIQTKTGFIYLTIVMDLYDRKIVGWSLSGSLLTKETTIPALEMAVRNRKVSPGLVFHSDRGVQYANRSFIDQIDAHKCIRSMSRKGCHLDNAVAESFFSSFKRELIYRSAELLTSEALKKEILDYIENWYNTKRIHSSLKYRTIEQFNSSSSEY
ncbi:IS3 family transposase [Flavobacterium ustbae]|uniref:IS3 family transposase n=1 Tax=Flavobacterium ustbae TaxID=2488790 RepID=UPI000F7B86DD|nr:IS3 family transposase [Flavobacterium ustbae]